MALRNDFDQETTEQHAILELIGGRYRLVERIGEGHSAITYRARDMVLGRYVALKLMRAEFAGDETFLARFGREARAAASVNQPNVVQVYDYGAHQGQAYLVMSFVEGRTLKQVIADDGPMTPTATVELARQLLRGLAAIHAAGTVHRDVKPQNILVGDDRIARVADFGIARGKADHTLTAHGTAVGTVAYMAPEQIRGEPVSAATDLYALGAVLFEVMTGRPPFEGEHPVAIMHAHLQQTPPAPSRFVHAIPTALDAVILRALAKEPEQRYRSAVEMMRALDAAMPPASAHRHRQSKLDGLSGWIGPLVFVLVALMVLGGVLAAVLDDNSGDQTPNGTRPPDQQAPNLAAALLATSTPSATATARVVRAPVSTEPIPTATQPPPTETQPPPTATELPPTATVPQPTETQPPPPTPTLAPSQTPEPRIEPINEVAGTDSEAAVSIALQFSAEDWQGGYYRGDAEWYGRAWTAIYGAQSSNPSATLTFSLEAMPIEPATLTITGLDDEWADNNPIVITVNGVEIFAAPSPFESWDGVAQGEQAAWTAVPFTVPAGVLHEGVNEITLANQAQSASFGAPPYVLVSDAYLEITS